MRGKPRPKDQSGQKLYEAREKASKELGLPVDDMRVQHLAALMVGHEACQAAIAAGDVEAIDRLLKLDAALHAMHAFKQEVCRVDLAFITTIGPEAEFESCQQCGWKPPRLTTEELRANYRDLKARRAAGEALRAEALGTPTPDANSAPATAPAPAETVEYEGHGSTFVHKPEPKPEPEPVKVKPGDNRVFVEEVGPAWGDGSVCITTGTPRQTGYMP